MKIRRLARVGVVLVVVGISSLAATVLLKSPSHDRNWKTEYRVLPRVDIDGDNAKFYGIRSFSYNSDGSIRGARYYDREFDLKKLKSLSFGISHFYNYGLAHTFISFGFEDGRQLVISIEARQEIDESYHPLDGLLRDYELIYVVGDERDIIGLRTHIRKERVLLYGINVDQARMARFLRTMIGRVNQIHARPEFYNTLTDNCTTGLVRYAEKLSWFDKFINYKIILPGYSDEILYDAGLIANRLPFDQMRARARIDPSSTALDDPGFSTKIRNF